MLSRQRLTVHSRCEVIWDFCVFHRSDCSQSSNGTWVNRQLVGRGKKTTLRNTDEVTFVLPRSRHSMVPANGADTVSFIFHDRRHRTGQHQIRDSSLLGSKYRWVKQLGAGSFGIVHLVSTKVPSLELLVIGFHTGYSSRNRR